MHNQITKGMLVRFSTIAIFIILSIASLIFAFYMFIEANSTTSYILSCAFLGISLFAGFFNVYAAISYFRSYFYDRYIEGISSKLKPLRSFPKIAVVMAVFNEDVEEVKRDMSRLFEFDYPKNRLKYYMVDDSTIPETKEQLESYCKSNKVTFLHRDSRKGYKAGAINNMLKICKEDFLAVIDADEYLTDTRFLKDLLPYFNDKDVAFVQTEKRSAKGNFFAQAVDLFDGFFFKFIQPHRALNNTALFAGSCGVIRKSALDKIGGFPEYVIEDTFFSFESDMHNFKSLYVPKVYARGRPMDSYTALVKQQWRYNYGDTQFIGYYMKRNRESGRLTPWASLDYLTHGFGLNYLSVVLIAFTILSVFLAFSTLPFAHLGGLRALFEATYISRYLEIFGGAAFVLSIIAPVILTKIYFGSFKLGLMVFILNFALAISRAKAAIAALSGKNPIWRAVRAKGGNTKHNLAYAISNTKIEVVFSAGLLSLGTLALLTNNLLGSVWLGTYGVLYLFATLLLYRYG
ncbi:MAG TPA: glycosyltransferase [Candidatus Acidoferrum sp.]|nr:glycosyltransferase [Candidatus Acidoferrum sp.]